MAVTTSTLIEFRTGLLNHRGYHFLDDHRAGEQVRVFQQVALVGEDLLDAIFAPLPADQEWSPLERTSQ